MATHAAAMVAQHGLKIVAFGLAGFAFGQWLPMVVAMIVTGYLGTRYGTRWGWTRCRKKLSAAGSKSASACWRWTFCGAG